MNKTKFYAILALIYLTSQSVIVGLTWFSLVTTDIVVIKVMSLALGVFIMAISTVKFVLAMQWYQICKESANAA